MSDDEATVELETVPLEVDAEAPPAPAMVPAAEPAGTSTAPDRARAAPTHWDIAMRRERTRRRTQLAITALVIIAIALVVLVARLLAG